MSLQTSSLPSPDPISEAHAEKVKNYLIDLIAQHPEQKLNFAEFMRQVLYTPNIGYYATGNQKFGKEGDFITAPEISPLFSQCLANQVQQILDQVQEGEILEIGAGTGKMAVDIMHALAKMKSLPKKYYILEISAELQHRQKQYIMQNAAEFYSYFHWLSALPSVPIHGVILANEVLDAMPCHRFRINNGQIQEYFVTVNQAELVWQLDQPSSEKVKNTINALQILDYENYSSEISLIHPAWILSLTDSLAQGLILLIDYGYPESEYYHRQRNMGTLKCFFRHHQHEDPLILTGIQDITTHVNFTAIARAASSAGLDVNGFTNQGSFLINCGIDKLLQTINGDVEYMNAVQQVKKLTLPTEMGELFKVMGISRKIAGDLLGFKNFSRLHAL